MSYKLHALLLSATIFGICFDGAAAINTCTSSEGLYTSQYHVVDAARLMPGQCKCFEADENNASPNASSGNNAGGGTCWN